MVVTGDEDGGGAGVDYIMMDILCFLFLYTL